MRPDRNLQEIGRHGRRHTCGRPAAILSYNSFAEWLFLLILRRSAEASAAPHEAAGFPVAARKARSSGHEAIPLRDGALSNFPSRWGRRGRTRWREKPVRGFRLPVGPIAASVVAGQP